MVMVTHISTWRIFQVEMCVEINEQGLCRKTFMLNFMVIFPLCIRTEKVLCFQSSDVDISEQVEEEPIK